MKKKMKMLNSFVLALALSLGLAAPARAAGAADAGDFGSLADSYVETAGEPFALNSESRLFVVGGAEPSGELLRTVQLAQRQFAADGTVNVGVLDIVWGSADRVLSGDIEVMLDPASGIGAEGYELEVDGSAKVTASDTDGLLYGLNALLKHLRAVGGNALSGLTMRDAPDTAERTVHLDCARKYFTKDWICNFIKQMSWMGYNTLEFHFSEDGGFRMDIWDPAYYTDGYSPEDDMSWICGSHVQSWVKEPYREDGDAGKYLTASEVVEILNTAREYHIEVIPSFDSPAHMDYLTWRFEQNYRNDPGYSFIYDGSTYTAASVDGCINYTGRTGSASPAWPDYTTVDITDPVAKAFVFRLYTDLADFFWVYGGSTKFNIGADEVDLTASGSIKWGYSDFPGYVNELNRLLRGKGYTTRMFNDFLHADALSQLDDDIEILYWNSPLEPTGNGREPILPVEDLVADGRVLYNAIQTNTYYVLRVAEENTDYPNMDARDPENHNWAFYHGDEESIYHEWYPADISEHGRYSEDAADVPDSQLGGGYFLLWNDYAAVATEAQVWNGMDDTGRWNVIDRMWSNSIKMWNWDADDSVPYETFAAVRDRLGDFPGMSGCSEEAALPAPTAPREEAPPAEAPEAEKQMQSAAVEPVPAPDEVSPAHRNGLPGLVDAIIHLLRELFRALLSWLQL